MLPASWLDQLKYMGKKPSQMGEKNGGEANPMRRVECVYGLIMFEVTEIFK